MVDHQGSSQSSDHKGARIRFIAGKYKGEYGWIDKKRGFTPKMVYVIVEASELQVREVQTRVMKSSIQEVAVVPPSAPLHLPSAPRGQIRRNQASLQRRSTSRQQVAPAPPTARAGEPSRTLIPPPVSQRLFEEVRPVSPVPRHGQEGITQSISHNRRRIHALVRTRRSRSTNTTTTISQTPTAVRNDHPPPPSTEIATASTANTTLSNTTIPSDVSPRPPPPTALTTTPPNLVRNTPTAVRDNMSTTPSSTSIIPPETSSPPPTPRVQRILRENPEVERLMDMVAQLVTADPEFSSASHGPDLTSILTIQALKIHRASQQQRDQASAGDNNSSVARPPIEQDTTVPPTTTDHAAGARTPPSVVELDNDDQDSDNDLASMDSNAMYDWQDGAASANNGSCCSSSLVIL